MSTTLTQRPMTADDAVLWAELLAACEEVDQRGEHYDAADCAEELADPGLDLAADSVLILDGDRPVAAQVLHLRVGAQRYLQTDAAVHPGYRGRGIGTELIAVARLRAAMLDAQVVVQVAEENRGAVALAEGSGMRAVRWWSEMLRDLTRPVEPAPLPEGLRLAPLGPVYDHARWDEPLRIAHNAAFADHWGSAPVSPESWVAIRTASRNFRPGCSVAALDGDGAVAGYVMGYEYEADTAGTGVRELYVATVGTVRSWRGRGVAAALLAHVLGRAVDDGFTRSGLTVDGANPTGALGVYARAGYVLRRREVSYCEP